MSEQQNNQANNMDSTISLAALSAMSIDDKTSGQTDMAHMNAKTNNSPANSHLSSGSALANSANSGGSGIIEGSLTKLNDDNIHQHQQQHQQQFDAQQPQQFDQQDQQFQQHLQNQPQQFDQSQHIQQQQYEPLQLPIITPEDLPPDMLEAFNSLEPNQQVQALEMLAQQQLLGTFGTVFIFVSFVGEYLLLGALFYWMGQGLWCFLLGFAGVFCGGLYEIGGGYNCGCWGGRP